MFERAYKLALKGQGFTSPNPCVGAVIVKDGKIIGEGFHKKAGTDHSEIVAIKSVKNKKDLKNSSLYVTLEPCNHYGKTPPCTKAIIKYGISKVFIGMKDPIHKGGILELKKHNIETQLLPTNSELAKKIKFMNRAFLKHAKTKMPYVIMKAGISKDGKIAAHKGKKGWITSKKARMDAKEERSKCDAVLVGSGTVRIDNPELGTSSKYKSKKLLRVIIDKELTLKTNKKVFRDKNVLVACTDLASNKDKKRFQGANINFKSFGKKRVNIPSLLRYLGKNNVQTLFVEGGAKVFSSFRDYSDELLLYVSPKVIGNKDSLGMFGDSGLNPISSHKKEAYICAEKIGKDEELRISLNNIN